MRSPPPPIHTEEVPPNAEIVRGQFSGQFTGQALTSLNPTDSNLRTAGLTVLVIAGLGVLLAVRNPKFAMGIMTGTLGASILAGYVALTASGQPTAWDVSSSSSGA